MKKRSLENVPDPAMSRMALRVHPGVRVQLERPPVRLEMGGEVGEVHGVIAARQQSLAERLEDAGLEAAQVAREDQ